MTPSLLPAILRPELAARVAWREWRQALHAFEDLTYLQQLLLPVLGRRLSQWTADDPDAARFRGIIRMAWTRNQVRLHAAAGLHMALTAADVPAAWAGPVAFALRAESRDAVRAISHFTVVIPRGQLAAATTALEREGWDAGGWLPGADARDWLGHIRLNRGSDVLYLHWRVYPAVFYRARETEHACLGRLKEIDWNGHTFRVIGDADALLHRVTMSPPEDPMPWESDLSFLSLDALDWGRIRSDVRTFGLAPDSLHPLARLSALRQAFPELGIPEFTAAECAVRSCRPHQLWREYRNQRAYLGRPGDVPGFLRFLSGGARREWHRWQRRLSWKS